MAGRRRREEQRCYDAKRNGIYYGNSGQDSALDGNYIHDVGKHGVILNGDAKAGGEGLMLRMAVRNNRIVNAGKDVLSNGDGCGVCCLARAGGDHPEQPDRQLGHRRHPA